MSTQIPYVQKRKQMIYFINLQENFNGTQKSMNMNILKISEFLKEFKNGSQILLLREEEDLLLYISA